MNALEENGITVPMASSSDGDGMRGVATNRGDSRRAAAGGQGLGVGNILQSGSRWRDHGGSLSDGEDYGSVRCVIPASLVMALTDRRGHPGRRGEPRVSSPAPWQHQLPRSRTLRTRLPSSHPSPPHLSTRQSPSMPLHHSRIAIGRPGRHLRPSTGSSRPGRWRTRISPHRQQTRRRRLLRRTCNRVAAATQRDRLTRLLPFRTVT